MEGDEQDEVTSVIQKSQLTRKLAEHSAKQLLQRLDRNCGLGTPGCSSSSPWEELSCNSHTARYAILAHCKNVGVLYYMYIVTCHTLFYLECSNGKKDCINVYVGHTMF